MDNTHEDRNVRELIQKAEDAVRQAEQSIEASDQVLRDMGLDPAKVMTVLTEQPLTPEQQEEAQALFRKDMEEIEETTQREAAHARQRSLPNTGGASKMHRMV